MKEEKSNRTRIIGIRLKPDEFEKIYLRFKSTTCRKLSEYVRQVLLEGSVTIYTRDQSMDDFMAEMIQLRIQLQGVGNNFNQAVHKLHTMHIFPEILTWLLLNDGQIKDLFRRIEEIKLHINKVADKW
jgi:MobC-like protein